MAWLHGIWIHTTSDEAEEAVFKHFQQFDNLVINDITYTFFYQKGGFIYAQGEGINNRGIDSTEEALLLTKISLEYYKMLRTAPPFLYALAGVETEEAIMYNELVEDPNWMMNIQGFVINKQLYEKILTPELQQFEGFKTFSEGYVWTTYLGEKKY